MADLLECLLQIKGLRETGNRVRALMRSVDARSRSQPEEGQGPTAAETLAQMADSESLHGEWLRIILAARRAAPALTGAPATVAHSGSQVPSAGLDRFLAQREDNLGVLDGCSAEDLARTGVLANGRLMTIADIVAVMLADDMDRLGDIRRALGV